MTKHFDFEVVGDDRRRESGSHMPTSPLWAAVRDGQTVLVKDADMRTLHAARTMLARDGLALHVRTDPDGVVVWADRKNGGS